MKESTKDHTKNVYDHLNAVWQHTANIGSERSAEGHFFKVI